MSQQQQQVEGIVLKAIPYKENDRILTIFTSESGAMSLYVRGASKNKLSLMNLTTPFCRAEFIFRKGQSDLYRFIDGTILDLHLPLRKSYQHMACGGKMLGSILRSQMPGKSAHHLYRLLLSFLKKLPDFSHPETAWASFQLKLLKHEGLLSITEKCPLCKNAPASQILGGESRCKTCAPAQSFSFLEEEWALLHVLFTARSFNFLIDLQLKSSLMQKIDALYESFFS